MNDYPPLHLRLTLEEREFLMRLMMARPPVSDEAHGVFTAVDGLSDIPESDYRDVWMALDNKLRSATPERGHE